MGSGQSKPIDNNRTYLTQNDSLLCKPNKFSLGKPTYKLRPMSLRERNGLRTSSQSDGSPGYVDDPPLKIGTIFRKSIGSNNRRGYNSLKEPINRKYPWRGGTENEKSISLLPKQHSLKPWGPIKGYYASDGSYSSPNDSFQKETLKARDEQSRFCHEIHERYVSMGETEKRRRLEAIQALENKLQNKSGFSAQAGINKRGSLRLQALKSQTSTNGSIIGVPKKTNESSEPDRNSEIHAWRVEHVSNFEKHRASSIDKTGKTKVISHRYNENIRNPDKDFNEKAVELFNAGYMKTEVPASEINTRRNCKRRSNAMYVNKMYNYSRLNTLMANGGNYSKQKGRSGKGMLYPRQTSKAVFLLLKTFADRSPSPIPTRHTKSGDDAAFLCDKATSISSENFNLSFKSVETQTTPVHISRKLNLDSIILSKLDKVPKLEVDHRGSLTRHVSSTPSTRTLSSTQQVVLGYSHGVTIDTRKRNEDHGRRRNATREKDSIDDWSSSDKLAARRMIAENIRQKNALRDKESMYDRTNNEKFITRRIAPENSRQRAINHEKVSDEGRSSNDKFATRRMCPINTTRDRPQNGPFSADTHNHLCYHATNDYNTESKSRSAQNPRHFERQRYEERDRLSERTYGPPNPARSYQNPHHKTDTAKEEYYRSQQKRCRIPVPTQHRYDRNDDLASVEKRILKRETDAASNKERIKMNSEEYKSLCKMRLDLVNGGGDRYVPNVRYENRNSGSPDEDSEDVERLLCGRKKSCRHWGKSSATRCNVCLERICYDIKEDEEDSENSHRLT